MSATEIAILTGLPAAFVGAFVGAWLSVILSAKDKHKQDRAIAQACLETLKNITEGNLSNITKIIEAQQAGASGPAQILPALQISIYGALLPQLPLVGVDPDVIVEVGKTFGFLKDMQEVHYTVLNLNLQDYAGMREGLKRSEIPFTFEANKQLAKLKKVLEAGRFRAA